MPFPSLTPLPQRRHIAFALVVLLLAGGCGGDTSRDERADEPEVRLGDTSAPAPPSTTTESTDTARTRPAARPSPVAARPPIKQWPIPFSAARERETAEYSQRHYGVRTTALEPRVIVEHYTVTPTAQATFDIFARDQPDVELHELPGLCSHFLIDRDGTIFQLVPLTRICRHTVGLNRFAIGIEHVGGSDSEVLGNRRQLAASLRLTGWLRCRYGIEAGDVIGHAESLGSPYHDERMASLKRQTHQDFPRSAMRGYRARLAERSC